MSQVTHSFQIDNRLADCTGESSRYAIGHVQAIPAGEGKAHLAATDTRILAILKVDGHCPEPVLIPAEALPKKAKRKSDRPTVTLNGKWENSDGKFVEVQDTGRFPPAAAVLPDLQDGHDYIPLRINVDALLALAKALNDADLTYFGHDRARCLTLLLPIPTEREKYKAGESVCFEDAIPVVGSDGFGVIMPVTENQSSRAKYLERRAEYVEHATAAIPR